MNLWINHKIIVWARERNGFSIEELAEKTKRKPDEIEMWEVGNESPSYNQLERLADTLKTPLAVFFFPEPPNLDDPKKKFRRLPNYEFERFSPDTIQTIRLAQAYQDSLTDFYKDTAPARRIFREFDSQLLSAQALAGRARAFLDISNKQQQQFGSAETAFKAWRHSLETVGIYTFKGTLKDRHISGFCLLDEKFPIIFVNNSNSFSRQVFTIAHELGHILMGVNGVTDQDETYVDMMSSDEQALERKCNAFAAEFLVPKDEFRKDVSLFQARGVDAIPDLASKYSVSREVILRRLLELGLVTTDDYEALSRQWNKDYSRSRQKEAGGNYYYTRLSYLGEGFTKLAFQNYYEGRFTKIEVSTHLNINSRNLDKLEKHLSW